MIDVMAKVDCIIDVIDNDITVARMKTLKALIDSDPAIKQLYRNFEELRIKYYKDGVVTREFAEAKEKLYNNPVITEYRNLYSQLNLNFIKFNKNISSLIDARNHPCNAPISEI